MSNDNCFNLFTGPSSTQSALCIASEPKDESW